VSRGTGSGRRGSEGVRDQVEDIIIEGVFRVGM
jgi:hypothetical protein